MTWGFDRDFVPWGKREEELEPRIYDYLTDPARKRIARIVENVSNYDDLVNTYGEFRTEIVDEPEYFDIRNRKPAYGSQTKLIREEDTDEVLIYLEILLNTIWSNTNHSVKDLLKMDSKIRRTLHETGVLFRLKPEHKYLKRVCTDSEGSLRYRYVPDNYEYFHFERLSDETIIEADQDLRVLTEGKKWEDALSGYNEAWNEYQKGNFSAIIAEKLYNSLEDVLQQICVEQDWENKNQSFGTYLDRLNEEGLFDANQSMIYEWEQILTGIRAGVQKTGDRKNWHDEFRQDYCILLLHQTSAFLTFVIKRYEDEYQ
jgi:hypothetical protein